VVVGGEIEQAVQSGRFGDQVRRGGTISDE
jgi:hypothetical protein